MRGGPLMTPRSRLVAAVVALALVAAVWYAVGQHLIVHVTEESLLPQVVTPSESDPLTLRVGVIWTESGWCAGQFRVKATETTTQVRVGPVISRTSSGGACAGLGTVDNMAWASLTLASPLGPRSTVRDSDGVPLPVHVFVTRLACETAIASRPVPPADQSVVLNEVALPTVSALQASPSGEADSSARLFAKAALFVDSGARFALVVPPEWVGRLTIGWGSPPQRASHVAVPGCQATGSQQRWLVYGGGFWVSEPACVPLLVTSGNQQQTVNIGVGASCPGQAAPPPGQ